MQSIAPNIIKHFIPYEFSKNVLDLQVIPKNTNSQKDENPLQNIKLRNLQKQAERQLVLTYKNKSNALYRSRKSINYQNLFRELEEQRQKLKLVKEQMQQPQKNTSAKEPEFLRGSKGSVNQLCFQEKNQIQEKGYHSLRKLQTQHMKRRINISSRGRTAEDGRARSTTHRLYSSINFREYNQRIIADYSKNSELQQSPLNNMSKQSVKRLKIRGRQAPERQMIDHLRRSSTSSDLVISINRCDKKR